MNQMTYNSEVAASLLMGLREGERPTANSTPTKQLPTVNSSPTAQVEVPNDEIRRRGGRPSTLSDQDDLIIVREIAAKRAHVTKYGKKQNMDCSLHSLH